LIPALEGDALEIDELVVRVGRKRRYRYLWVAVSHRTRQVVAWCLGDRSAVTLRRLWARVPGLYRRQLVYSDPYEAYASFFGSWQHRVVSKGSGKTSIVEGLNNKWRARVSGLVRRTVCVQHEADLERRLWLVIAQHNDGCHHRIQHCA
jgi:insertion element IS1 protein InsB